MFLQMLAMWHISRTAFEFVHSSIRLELGVFVNCVARPALMVSGEVWPIIGEKIAAKIPFAQLHVLGEYYNVISIITMCDM